ALIAALAELNGPGFGLQARLAWSRLYFWIVYRMRHAPRANENGAEVRAVPGSRSRARSALAPAAVAVAVEEVDEQAQDDPGRHPNPVVDERATAEPEADHRAERADDVDARHAERTRQVRARVAQHE